MLSIIVITTDRIPLLERFFLSLCRQTCAEFEVVVVHNLSISQQDTSFLRNNLSKFAVRVYQSVDNCLSRSRNLALSRIRGDIFCIADDDCLYEPDTVENVLDAFRKNPAVYGIMGQHIGPEEGGVKRKAEYSLLNSHDLFRACPSYVHFYRTKILASVGFFDETLGVGCGTPYQSGEETDFALRTLRAGFAIARASAVLVRHPHENLRSPFLKRKVRAYAVGRMHLLRKHQCSPLFVAANILYPLVALPCECCVACAAIVRYRWTMFWERLRNVKDRK